MIRKSLQEEIEKILLPGQVRYNERLDRHCSFRTGGPADALVFVRTAGELSALLGLLRAEGMEYFILGRGTNLLIGDGGYRGVIITPYCPPGTGETGTEASGTGNSDTKITGTEASGSEGSGTKMSGRVSSRENSQGETAGRQENWYEELLEAEHPFPLNGIRILDGGRIFAGAGAALQAVSAAALDQGLSGLEFASGIPGTVGGALVMNAGAYDGEIKQTVTGVAGMMPDGTTALLSGEQMEFGYRTSILKRVPMIALGAEFVLRPDDPARIRDRIRDFAARRREKQPLEYPSAGSTFKRPEGYFAGKLIMDAGLRGYRVGDAQVSEKHCGFVINRGAATSLQIRKLIEDVQKKVLEDSGVALEREVIFLGEF